MNEKKKFELSEIIVLLILAITNDALIVFADLAFLIPIIGQITFLAMMAASFVIWGIIFLWFTLKLGFAGPIGLLQIGGGILAEIGLPVRTATVITGIFMANNPKAAKLGKLAGEAALIAATGGAAAAAAPTVAGAGAAAGGATAAAGAAAAGTEAAAGAEAVSGGAVAGAAESAAGKAAAEAERGVSEEAFGMPKGWEEKQKELFEKPPEAQLEPEEEEDEAGGKVIRAAERFRGKKEEEEGQEPEIEAARLGGAYKLTAEEQQKEALREAGLTEEIGTTGKKPEEIEANGTVVNFKGRDENLKKAA